VNPPVTPPAGLDLDTLRAVIEALPVGITIVDPAQRIVLVNPAYCASLDLPPNSFPPGMPLVQALRAAAYRGMYGPGDPERLASETAALDRRRPGRLRRRTHNGRSYDVITAPLPNGGHVACAVEMTALVAARTEAEASVTRLTGALATWRAGFAVFQPDRTLLYANLRFAGMLDLPADAVRTGMTLEAILDVMARSEGYTNRNSEAFIAAQRALDRSAPSAVRRTRSNGQVIWIGSDPLPDGGWTVTLADITLIATTEDEAQRRARSLSVVLETIPHGVCVYGADRRVTMFNRAYSEVMEGAPLAIGDHMVDVIRRCAEAGEYGPGSPDQIATEQLAVDISRPQMRERQRPNGTTIVARTAPLPDGGHINVVTDITPLITAKAELSRRADEVAVMLGCIRQGILMWDAGKRLIASNGVAAALLNHPPGLLTHGRTETEIIDHMFQRGEFGDGEPALAMARAVLDRDHSVPHQRTITTRAGRVLELRSDPTPGGGWVTTYTDVTEARRAEEELRRAKEAAEAANQAKSRFLATMSHELRTPLNAVIGFSDALLRESENPTPTRVAEFARQINESGRNLLGLINIILDVARIESGRFDLMSERVDVVRLVRTAVRQVDAAAQAAEIALTAELPRTLPMLRGDERRLAQVLRNLLSNAVKFTEIGGSVAAGARLEPNGGLLIYVRDTGIGIPGDELDRVFEPFTQIESTLSRRFQGAGLGLYMSRALVAGHGGTLALRSELGEGTIAEIRLPADMLFADGGQPSVP
jgi:signal transduction histidine kinase